jgi:hypothetical protein
MYNRGQRFWQNVRKMLGVINFWIGKRFFWGNIFWVVFGKNRFLGQKFRKWPF